MTANVPTPAGGPPDFHQFGLLLRGGDVWVGKERLVPDPNTPPISPQFTFDPDASGSAAASSSGSGSAVGPGTPSSSAVNAGTQTMSDSGTAILCTAVPCGGSGRPNSCVSPRTTRAASPVYAARQPEGIPFKDPFAEHRDPGASGRDRESMFAQWAAARRQQHAYRQQRRQQHEQYHQQPQDQQAPTSTQHSWLPNDPSWWQPRDNEPRPRNDSVVHYLPYEGIDALQHRLNEVDGKVDRIADSMARLARSVEELAARMPPPATSTAPQEPLPQVDLSDANWDQYMAFFRQPQYHHAYQHVPTYQNEYAQDYSQYGYQYPAQYVQSQYHAPSPYSYGYSSHASATAPQQQHISPEECPPVSARRNAIQPHADSLAAPSGGSSRRPSAAAAVSPAYSVPGPLADQRVAPYAPPLAPKDVRENKAEDDGDEDDACPVGESEARRRAAEFLQRPRQMSGWDSETESEDEEDDGDDDDEEVEVPYEYEEVKEAGDDDDGSTDLGIDNIDALTFAEPEPKPDDDEAASVARAVKVGPASRTAPAHDDEHASAGTTPPSFARGRNASMPNPTLPAPSAGAAAGPRTSTDAAILSLNGRNARAFARAESIRRCRRRPAAAAGRRRGPGRAGPAARRRRLPAAARARAGGGAAPRAGTRRRRRRRRAPGLALLPRAGGAPVAPPVPAAAPGAAGARARARPRAAAAPVAGRAPAAA